MERGVGYLRVVLIGLGAACACLLVVYALWGAPEGPPPVADALEDSEPPADAPNAAVPFSALDLTGVTEIPRSALLHEADEDGTRTYLSYVGPIRVAAHFAEFGEEGAYGALREALALALVEERGLPEGSEPWTWIPFGTFGGGLLHPDGDCLLMGHDVLLPERLPARDMAAEIRRVRAAGHRLIAAAEADGVSTPWVIGAMREVATLLEQAPGDPSRAALDPCFARRVVAQEGWLDTMFPQLDAAVRGELVEAVRASLASTALQRHTDGPRTVTHIGNAWGVQGIHLTLGGLSVLLTAAPTPMHSSSRMRVLRHCFMMHQLPDWGDPLEDQGVIDKAHVSFLLWAGRPIASWSPDKRELLYDHEMWRVAFPAYKGSIVENAWPPHLCIQGLDGNLRGVVVPEGFLRPVADGSAAEIERFLADAARMLETPAHLDLLQQYFVRYAYDSPDVRMPSMLGSATHSADIHQTAIETLKTCAGGVCRGDCDDFAEVLQWIVRRQGHLSYVAGVPGHVATVWAVSHEATDDAEAHWRVYVLQSGPSREFRAPELSEALRKAFRKLAPHTPFSEHGMSIMLRFDDGNTRASHGLPARIFHDKLYARAIVDVQRDWHRYTLHGAERRMKVLIEEHGASIGTLGEMAAVYTSMGRSKEAAALRAKVLAELVHPENRLIESVDRVGDLADAEELDAMRREALRIVEEDLPRLAPTLGLRTLSILLDLASQVRSADVALSRRVLHAVIHQHVEGVKGSLATLLDPAQDAKAWREHEHNRGLQRLAEDVAWSARSLALRSREEPDPKQELAAILRVVDVWLERHALDDAEEADDRNVAWGLRALRLQATDPGFLGEVLTTEPPQAAATPAALTGPAYRRAVARWARASTWFFAVMMQREATAKGTPPDPEAMRVLARAMQEADGHAARLGLQGPAGARRQRLARLNMVLVTKDEAGLRSILASLEAEGDRRNIRSAAAAVGRAARYADLAWWRRILVTWDAVFDTRHHRMRFAWFARRADRHEHARLAAEAGARSFPDDEDLQEEARAFRGEAAR